MRDSIRSLGCDGASKAAGIFDDSKFPFLKEEQTWDFSLKNSVITTSSGSTETKIFWLKTEGLENGRFTNATLINAVPLNYLIPNWWAATGKKWACSSGFEGDNLVFSCDNDGETAVFTGQFELTTVDCIKPKLNGMIHYKGGYYKPAADWEVNGKLFWDPLTPPDCKEN